MATIEAIAKKAGVSRGTVDRVLHNRGRVNPETAERVRAVVRELDFQPNSLGRAFYLARQKNKVGILLGFREPDFEHMVTRGVADGIVYAKQYGIEVLTETVSPDDTAGYLAALRRLIDSGIRGLALRGIASEEVRACLAALPRERMDIVAFNEDVDQSLRDCFVGQESYRSGACAGHLMQQISPREGCTLIIGVNPRHISSEERIQGFVDHFRNLEQSMELPVIYGGGSYEQTYQMTRERLSTMPGLTGIFVSGAGLSGAARAIEEAGLARKIKLVGYDVTDSNLSYMEKGVVQFVIDQNPYMQGYKSVQLLIDAIFQDQPIENDYFEVGIEIRNLYNAR